MSTALFCVALLAGASVAAAPTVQDPVQDPKETPPPVFAQKSLADALAAVKGTDKILVVKATAVWCVPCKRMDQTTWRDAKVVQWFEQNGMAIAVDVDAVPRDAKLLRIESMPTMVAFKGDDEFDRVVGYKDAAELLLWLDDVKAGRRRSDAAIARAADFASGKVKLSVDERLDLARTLATAEQFDAALGLYVNLWEAIPKEEPPMMGVRGSFMASDMQRLGQKHEPARTRFVALRDALEPPLEKGGASVLRDDWIVLNEVVGDEDRTMRWVDAALADAKERMALERSSFRIERMLQQRERWADLGRLIRDPMERIEFHKQVASMTAGRPTPGMDEEMKKMLAEHELTSQRELYGSLYAAMLASGRADEARRVHDDALATEDSEAMRAVLADFEKRSKLPPRSKEAAETPK